MQAVDYCLLGIESVGETFLGTTKLVWQAKLLLPSGDTRVIEVGPEFKASSSEKGMDQFRQNLVDVLKLKGWQTAGPDVGILWRAAPDSHDGAYEYCLIGPESPTHFPTFCKASRLTPRGGETIARSDTAFPIATLASGYAQLTGELVRAGWKDVGNCTLVRRLVAAEPEALSKSTSGDPSAQLRTLKSMWSEGLITEEEFQFKKAEVLKQI